MTVIGYLRVSTDQQDVEKQRHLLLDYAQANQMMIDEFIRAEMSATRSPAERCIDELSEKLAAGDVLLVAELSRLGRNMLQTLNLINELSERGVQISFIRQPELSTIGPHGQLLLAIYSHFAETERAYISLRTRQGMAAAKAQGKQLGRPKGSRNKKRVLDPHRDQILTYLEMGLNLATVMKLINPELEKPITYNAYRYFVQHDAELLQAWQAQR